MPACPLINFRADDHFVVDFLPLSLSCRHLVEPKLQISRVSKALGFSKNEKEGFLDEVAHCRHTRVNRANAFSSVEHGLNSLGHYLEWGARVSVIWRGINPGAGVLRLEKTKTGKSWRPIGARGSRC